MNHRLTLILLLSCLTQVSGRAVARATLGASAEIITAGGGIFSRSAASFPIKPGSGAPSGTRRGSFSGSVSETTNAGPAGKSSAILDQGSLIPGMESVKLHNSVRPQSDRSRSSRHASGSADGSAPARVKHKLPSPGPPPEKPLPALPLPSSQKPLPALPLQPQKNAFVLSPAPPPQKRLPALPSPPSRATPPGSPHSPTAAQVPRGGMRPVDHRLEYPNPMRAEEMPLTNYEIRSDPRLVSTGMVLDSTLQKAVSQRSGVDEITAISPLKFGYNVWTTPTRVRGDNLPPWQHLVNKPMGDDTADFVHLVVAPKKGYKPVLDAAYYPNKRILVMKNLVPDNTHTNPARHDGARLPLHEIIWQSLQSAHPGKKVPELDVIYLLQLPRGSESYTIGWQTINQNARGGTSLGTVERGLKERVEDDYARTVGSDIIAPTSRLLASHPNGMGGKIIHAIGFLQSPQQVYDRLPGVHTAIILRKPPIPNSKQSK